MSGQRGAIRLALPLKTTSVPNGWRLNRRDRPLLADVAGQSESIRCHTIRCTHWLRHAGASNGSAKYCVSCTTFPFLNSMMLTV